MAAVDVVVVSYNNRDELRGCVERLSHADDITVVVVDNASSDSSLESVADLPVVGIPMEENRGFAAGCNVGWRRGDGDYVLFLNPDARIEVEDVRRLTQTFEDNDTVGIAGPRILDEAGKVEFSIRSFPRFSSTYAQALFLHRLWPTASWVDEVVRDPNRYSTQRPVEWLSGACLAIRRPLLERLGGFDEGFFMYCEDKDLCRRTWQQGYSVVFEPAATAMHLGGGGASAPRDELIPTLATSRVRYARKHAGRIGIAVEQAGIALASLTHATVGRGSTRTRLGHARALVKALGRGSEASAAHQPRG